MVRSVFKRAADIEPAMKQTLLLAAVSALPQSPAISIPDYAMPSGPIELPYVGSTEVDGAVPLTADKFGQQYAIPNGSSYIGAFTATGPSTVGSGLNNAFNVDDGHGNTANGASYAATIASAPVVDGKQVKIQAAVAGSNTVQNFVIPGGQGTSTHSSSSSSFSQQS